MRARSRSRSGLGEPATNRSTQNLYRVLFRAKGCFTGLTFAVSFLFGCVIPNHCCRSSIWPAQLCFALPLSRTDGGRSYIPTLLSTWEWPLANHQWFLSLCTFSTMTFFYVCNAPQIAHFWCALILWHQETCSQFSSVLLLGLFQNFHR